MPWCGKHRWKESEAQELKCKSNDIGTNKERSIILNGVIKIVKGEWPPISIKYAVNTLMGDL